MFTDYDFLAEYRSKSILDTFGDYSGGFSREVLIDKVKTFVNDAFARVNEFDSLVRIRIEFYNELNGDFVDCSFRMTNAPSRIEIHINGEYMLYHSDLPVTLLIIHLDTLLKGD